MSSYEQITKHPVTGAWQKALWLDDYFGSHNYGVIFNKGTVNEYIADPRKEKLEVKERSEMDPADPQAIGRKK